MITKCFIELKSFKRNTLDRYTDTIHQYIEHWCIEMQPSNILHYNK